MSEPLRKHFTVKAVFVFRRAQPVRYDVDSTSWMKIHFDFADSLLATRWLGFLPLDNFSQGNSDMTKPGKDRTLAGELVSNCFLFLFDPMHAASLDSQQFKCNFVVSNSTEADLLSLLLLLFLFFAFSLVAALLRCCCDNIIAFCWYALSFWRQLSKLLH